MSANNFFNIFQTSFPFAYQQYFGIANLLEFAKKAAELGHVGVLLWLTNNNIFEIRNTQVIFTAAKFGQFQVVQWLRSLNPVCPWDEETFAGAILSQNNQLIQWMMNQNCPIDITAHRSAAEVGSKEIILWLKNQRQIDWDELVPFDALTATRTDNSTQISPEEMCLWLIDQGCPANSNLCNWAAEHGHLHLLQIFHSKGIQITSETICDATRTDRLEIVSWLLTNYCPIQQESIQKIHQKWPGVFSNIQFNIELEGH